MQTPSLAGNVYFFTFIDDYSRKTWVYLLKQKYEAFPVFKRFKAMVEKESENHIKILRSDRGGEYMLIDFIEFCQSHGIKRQFTARYTPQGNGRKNQTIMNIARSMLREKNLPSENWGEVVACAVYILNRSPTKSVKDRVLEEAQNGKSCHISHLRIFGCVAYVHVPKKLRKKLDDRSEKCIFIGYSDESKAYRLYNPITKNILSVEMLSSRKKKLGMEAQINMLRKQLYYLMEMIMKMSKKHKVDNQFHIHLLQACQ